MSLESLPCPFCGSLQSEVTAEGEASPRSYFVQCLRCWACGPAAGKERYGRIEDEIEKQKAVTAWNSRSRGERFGLPSLLRSPKIAKTY